MKEKIIALIIPGLAIFGLVTGIVVMGTEYLQAKKLTDNVLTERLESCRYYNEWYQGMWDNLGRTMASSTEDQLRNDFIDCLRYKN